MRIQGKLHADIAGLQLKRNKSHDGKQAFVDLEIGVSEEAAASAFGEDFKLLAFATMKVVEGEGEDGEDEVVFLQDNVKPGQRVVFEKHDVELLGYRVPTQPQLRSIRTLKGNRKVVAVIRLPVGLEESALISALTEAFAEPDPELVEFSPQQGTLKFVTKDGGDGSVPDEEPPAQAAAAH